MEGSGLGRKKEGKKEMVDVGRAWALAGNEEKKRKRGVLSWAWC